MCVWLKSNKECFSIITKTLIYFVCLFVVLFKRYKKSFFDPLKAQKNFFFSLSERATIEQLLPFKKKQQRFFLFVFLCAWNYLKKLRLGKKFFPKRRTIYKWTDIYKIIILVCVKRIKTLLTTVNVCVLEQNTTTPAYQQLSTCAKQN